MRKYVVGAIAGALIVFAGQAAAESVSKIGRKVQAEYVVKVDGVPLEAKGLAVDGQTTVPARAFAEAVGYDVSFKNKEVILTKKEGENVEQKDPAPSEAEYTLESVESAIDERERYLQVSKDMLRIAESEKYSEEELTRLREGIKKQEDELENFKAIKTQLEALK